MEGHGHYQVGPNISRGIKQLKDEKNAMKIVLFEYGVTINTIT